VPALAGSNHPKRWAALVGYCHRDEVLDTEGSPVKGF
jgi:hypothetical protein